MKSVENISQVNLFEDEFLSIAVGIVTLAVALFTKDYDTTNNTMEKNLFILNRDLSNPGGAKSRAGL